MSIGQELLDVPFPEMIASMGLAIAQAQLEMDQTSLKIAQMMAGQEFITHDDEGNEVPNKILVDFGDGSGELSMLQLGFTPSFYHFVDTIIEVKVSIKISRQVTTSQSSFYGSMSGRLGFFSASASVSSVSASFATKYNYSAEGSSLIRTKIAPVPPPKILEERIRALIDSKN
ncbi:MAG: hypothetical protein LBG44_10055 [Gemmatimonadota bacterium]|jgi:hypothetical protein|nr:hypothetical protein [Gemmatimonadota bacterium]